MIYSSLFKNNKGFTLLELLVVIAIISAVSIFTFPFYANYLNNSFSKNSLLELESGLKKTRQKSFSSFDNSSFGVYFNKTSNNFVFYQGDSYESRRSDYVIGVDKSFQLTAPQESLDINFTKGTGEPSKEQVFVFLSKEGLEKRININKFGAIILD